MEPFEMPTKVKIGLFVFWSLILFGAGWALRPVSVKEEKSITVTNLDQNKKAEDNSSEKDHTVATKKTYYANGQLKSEETVLQDHLKESQKKLEEQLKLAELQLHETKVVEARPYVLIQAVMMAYNFETGEARYFNEASISGRVLGNVFLGLGYERRELQTPKKLVSEDIGKSVLTFEF